MIYAQGQVEKVLDHVGPEVRWFLLGGPADGDEAQVLHAARPAVKIVGFEPNYNMRRCQARRGFPGELVPCALWSHECELELRLMGHGEQAERSGSVVKWRDQPPDLIAGPVNGNYPPCSAAYKVPARTLDGLSANYGPFEDAFLWIDVEGAELAALQGAAGLLKAGKILLVSAEAFSDQEAALKDYLAGFGLREALRWQHQVKGDREWSDILFKLEK